MKRQKALGKPEERDRIFLLSTYTMLQIVLEVKAMNQSHILQIEDYCQVSPELSRERGQISPLLTTGRLILRPLFRTVHSTIPAGDKASLHLLIRALVYRVEILAVPRVRNRELVSKRLRIRSENPWNITDEISGFGNSRIERLAD